MYDQVHTCQNCHNPFVYSVYEQLQRGKRNTATADSLQTAKRADMVDSTPKFCPICTSIKANEQKHPPKPPKQA